MTETQTRTTAFTLIAILVFAGASIGYIAPAKVAFIVVLCAIGGAFATVVGSLVVSWFGVGQAPLVGTVIAMYLALFALGLVAGAVPNIGGFAFVMLCIVVASSVVNDVVGKVDSFRRAIK